jgi:nucleotide-binding universal stress UspA family protein
MTSMTVFNRILVPVDFSSCSHAACDLASSMAMKLGATIELLHVQEPPAWQGFVIPELVVNVPNEASTSLYKFVQTRTQRALEHLAEKLQHAGVTQVRHRQEAGEPGKVIISVAEEERFDLIVMGTHGRKGFERLVMGSVAERVVRRAPCPVLTVRVGDESVPEQAIFVQGEGAGT